MFEEYFAFYDNIKQLEDSFISQFIYFIHFIFRLIHLLYTDRYMKAEKRLW